MARKYLGRRVWNTGSKHDDDSKENIDNLDPFDVKERRFLISKSESLGNDSKYRLENIDDTEKELQSSINDTSLSEEIKKSAERIERIKKIHENFDNELKTLKNEVHSINFNQQSTDSTSEVFNLGTEISSLLSKSADQKIKILEIQLENERKRTNVLNKIIDENVEKIVSVEKELQVKIGQDMKDLVKNDGKQKIRVMELQLENEKKQSQKLYTDVSDKLTKINNFDKETRKQRDKLELEVQETNKKLLQAERLSAIGELAARVAHDLRNPLSVIKASIELIKVKTPSNENTFLIRQVAMIERAISRMSHQIEDVLDFVRPIPIQAMKNSLLKTIKLSIEKSKIPSGISLNLPTNDVEFEFDKDKIDVVFDNILTNSVQAIRDNGAINIRVNENPKTIRIEIEDSGPGIPDDVLPKIFEPLVTTKQTGTGLGLASCKSIVSQHNGTITVKNNPTTFIIELPRTQKK